MSCTISMMVREEGNEQVYYKSVDTAMDVAACWRVSMHDGDKLMPVRRVSFKALEDDKGNVHSRSPREVRDVDLIFINPHHVESVIDNSDNEREAAIQWRSENDESQVVHDPAGLLPSTFPLSKTV